MCYTVSTRICQSFFSNSSVIIEIISESCLHEGANEFDYEVRARFYIYSLLLIIFAQTSARQHLSQYGLVRAVQTSLP